MNKSNWINKYFHVHQRINNKKKKVHKKKQIINYEWNMSTAYCSLNKDMLLSLKSNAHPATMYYMYLSMYILQSSLHIKTCIVSKKKINFNWIELLYKGYELDY